MSHLIDKSSYKEYNAIDVLKFILSIFIMIIHSGIDKTVISPLLRTAVPLFFIISSYFFFSKNKNLSSQKEKNDALLRFVKRNLLLYLFWSLMQFPIMMYIRGYHHDLFPYGIWNAIRDFLSGRTFTGSWYLLSSVVGVVVIFLLSKRISIKWLVLITLPLYIICCLITNYGNILNESSIILWITNKYYALTGMHFYTSFPVALFWVSIGKFLVEHKLLIKRRSLLIICIVGAILLIMERYFIVRFTLSTIDDCYFTLIILCPLIFLLIKRSKLVFNTRFRIRELSVLIYVTHGCCERIVGYVLKLILGNFMGHETIKILFALMLIIVIGQFLIHTKEKYSVKFFKYAW